MTRLSTQNLTAVVVLVLLAVTAVLTRHADAPVGLSFASTDYRGGGYRAWAALLAREGVTTARFVLRPIELDDRIDTLVSAQPLAGVPDPAARTVADLAALSAWVRAGGRLVYIGRNPALRPAEHTILDLPFFLPDVGARAGLRGPLEASIGSLHELGTDRMLLVEHAGRGELSDGNGDIVVRYPQGRGEIWAVIDGVPFTNANIAGAGNARLAYVLGTPRKPGGVVAFDDGLHGALIDRPWYRALPLSLRVGLAILAVAGLLALGGSALGTGAPVRLRPAREPTSVEFVAALAALYERVHARSAAMTILVHDALAAAARANGSADRVPPAELAARVADPRRAAELRRLAQLLAAPVATDAALVAGGTLAHTVRKEWSHGGYGDGRRAAFAGRTRPSRRR